MTNLLLVEDDSAISTSVEYYLSKEGFHIQIVDQVKQGIEKIENNYYDLILLDVTLRDGNGFEMFSKIKKIRDIPVIFLTALDEEVNIVKGLEMGADDYITKPFHARELLSRIKNVLRRVSGFQEEICIENIRIDLKKAMVYKNEEEIILTALEYKILVMLFENKGRILSRSQILDCIWDISGDFVNDNTLTVYIKRIREKIEKDPNHPVIIQTIRGTGYKIGE